MKPLVRPNASFRTLTIGTTQGDLHRVMQDPWRRAVPAPGQPDESEEPCRRGSWTIPRRLTTGRCAGSTATSRCRAPARYGSGSPAAGSAAPTCTSPKATCRPGAVGSPRPRGRGPGRRAGGRARRGSPSGSGSASRGWATPTGPAGSAGAGRRTCAWTRCSPAGTATAATPMPAWPTRATPTGCPTSSTTSTPRRCCAPASSATGRCAAPRCLPAVGSASTVSAAARTSPPRSRCTRGCACTC